MSSIETRSSDRDSMFLLADLLAIDGGPAISVKVRNLSVRGMMVESDVPLPLGKRIEIELRNIGAVMGSVIWVQGRRIGIAFETEIDPKLARTQVYGGEKEAPGYARAALPAPRHDGWHGKLRRV